MTEPTTDRTVSRFGALDVCTVSDALDALALTGRVPDLVPMWEGARLAGRAVTMRLAEGSPPGGSSMVHLGARAIEAAGPDRVIVVDNAGRTATGAWGGLLSTAASIRGVGGVVIDGACRDVDEAREIGFAAFARRPVAATARGRVHEVSCGDPVSLAGVRVEPGDIVVADGSGCVVIAAATADAVLAKAEQIAERERQMYALLRSGGPVTEVLGAAYETMLRQP